MHDIKTIRDNPDAFDAAMKRRKLGAQSSDILKLDEERRGAQTALQELQAQRNAESQKIGEIKKSGGDASEVMAQVTALKNEMAILEERERTLADSLSQHLAALPNVLSAAVPDGADENDNVELRRWGDPRADKVPEHFEIGEALGLMDAETAAKMSGSRFTILSGALARLERALGMFFLDVHTGEHGYTEVSPPLLVKDHAMFGTGQLPKFAEDQFRTTRDDWLLPTAEVPLTNMVAESIIEPATLPRRYTAFTPCFRQEAGAAGRDTRGMIRQHQFYKVEMVSVMLPEESEAEHERMTRCAETVLEKLGLAHRTIVLCSGDTGFGAIRTYDIEVWLPGQQRYREISSCSNCGDFQARRMNARYRAGEKDIRFVHTLNGSGVAVGRALIAVMENYYDPSDGGIFVPDALKPYMGGVQKILKTA
ncbi:MAG: serine--tRNA ligase [Alphaproteobacteria bacterium]|nr:serine--tRNA ligase [Alphaproteobacteria bacterium]